MSPLFKMERDKIFGTHGYINDIPRIQPRLGLFNFIQKQLESIMRPWKSVTLKTVTQQILHVILIIIWIEIYKIFYQWALKIIDFQFLGRVFCQLEPGQVRICPRTPLVRKQTAGGNRKLHKSYYYYNFRWHKLVCRGVLQSSDWYACSPWYHIICNLVSLRPSSRSTESIWRLARNGLLNLFT